MKKHLTILSLFALISFISCGQSSDRTKSTEMEKKSTVKLESPDYVWDGKKIEKSDEEWKKILTADQYYVTREQGTDRAFNNEFWDNHEDGIYYCVCCGMPLMDSKHKFESGTGWPSFYQPINEKNIAVSTDMEIGYERDEVHCARCGAHLGHVFNDAPDQPTGLRYCMDSSCFIFKKR
ncbi:MAG: peptide-methionine (R)-S-oxide reductase MsrB [Fimbriimonadaceae bacterium]|nr:peptide-methionine (R)-S-oxide reductase MsrB [Chitinophagales bacterium]